MNFVLNVRNKLILINFLNDLDRRSKISYWGFSFSIQIILNNIIQLIAHQICINIMEIVFQLSLSYLRFVHFWFHLNFIKNLFFRPVLWKWGDFCMPHVLLLRKYLPIIINFIPLGDEILEMRPLLCVRPKLRIMQCFKINYVVLISLLSRIVS